MGGCVASKLEEEQEVVAICRERKHHLKLAVDRRYALAEAHFRYCQAVYGVSAAINLFVKCHSCPPSQFSITFPPPCPPSPPKLKENIVSNPLFLQQTPTEPTKEAIACESCGSSTTSSDSSEDDERVEHLERAEDQDKVFCSRNGPVPIRSEVYTQHNYDYYNMGMPPPAMPSPQREFGWDFFDPFATMRPEIISGYSRNSDDDVRVVREQEGIPELEEEEVDNRVEEVEERKVVRAGKKMRRVKHKESGIEVVRTVDGANVSQGEQQKGLTVIDTPVRGRELLEALKDIEDYFLRVYSSGKDVSKMLEVNRFHLQSNLEEIKENSTKLIQAISLRTTSSRSSSCKSLVASSSKSSSTWTEFNNDLFDDCGGMVSGSHSLTLGRLYAWEKKLYEEVKAGDSTRKIYEKKCSQLRNQDVRGEEGVAVDKTRAAIKDLYSRILVAIRSAESISENIEKLRDEELQPQIIELLHGVMHMWQIMLESHEIQNKIIFEVKLFTCPTYGKFSSNFHQQATRQLETELQNWRARFREYVSAQKLYVEALHDWLSKFVAPETEQYPRGRSNGPQCQFNGPPLLKICRDWLASMDNLPDKSVSYAIKSFTKDVRALWAQQGEELQQKRRVDSLSKELDRKILVFQKAENRIFESNISDRNSELGIDQRADNLRERKDLLDDFRSKVDIERGKHQSCMHETERLTLNGLQTGFSRVFESMVEFSKVSFKLYHELVTNRENGKRVENSSYIEGLDVEQEGSR